MSEPETQQPGAGPPQGKVVVTFDAGRFGIDLDQDPVEAKIGNDGLATIRWEVRGINMNPKFGVRFSNIVLVDVVDEAKIAKGEITKDWDRVNGQWVEWSFEPPEHQAEQTLVSYDIFCTYGMKSGVNQRRMGLRQSTGMDPTILTPPGN